MTLDHLAAQLRWAPLPPVQTGPAAAVAAIFRPGPDLLFIRRSEREGDPWSGHMAFPGGRAAPEDADARATAERETWEEVGLDLARDGELLGPLEPLTTPTRRTVIAPLTVTPFVYRLAQDPPLVPNHEVAALHWISLDRLRRGEGRGTLLYHWESMPLELPCVRLDGVLIWGITLRLVDDLLGRLGTEGPPPAP